MRVKVLIFCAVVSAGLLLPAGCRKKQQRTIVCFGDSLTTCGGRDGRYSDWLAKWLPNEIIINKAINGNTLADGRARFQSDVLDLKPDVVIIALGTADFWLMKRDVSQLKADLEDMVARAKNARIEVVIASCFGERDYITEEKSNSARNAMASPTEFGRWRKRFAKSTAASMYQICTPI